MRGFHVESRWIWMLNNSDAYRCISSTSVITIFLRRRGQPVVGDDRGQGCFLKMRYCRTLFLFLSLSLDHISPPPHPRRALGVIERSLLQVGGSLTSDHELRIIAVRGDRLSPGMHRSCAYYSLIGAHPYKSHANIPQTRNSLSLRPPQIAHVRNALHFNVRARRRAKGSEARDKVPYRHDLSSLSHTVPIARFPRPHVSDKPWFTAPLSVKINTSCVPAVVHNIVYIS